MKKKIICHIGMFKAASMFLQIVLREIDASVLQPRGVYSWVSLVAPAFPFVQPQMYQAVRELYECEGRFGFEYRNGLRPAIHDQPVNTVALL